MRLEIVQLPVGPIATNCWIARRPGAGEAVVVDPGGEAPRILAALEERGAAAAAVLVTHGHWDHLGAVADVAETTGAPVWMPAGERELLERLDELAPSELAFRPYRPDVLLEGPADLEAAGIAFEVVPVPGHSPAHVAYAAAGSLFSGDVLFAGGVGRTDLPGGDWETLVASIRALVERYPPETAVHPGHGPSTTLGHEAASNPFLSDLRAASG